MPYSQGSGEVDITWKRKKFKYKQILKKRVVKVDVGWQGKYIAPQVVIADVADRVHCAGFLLPDKGPVRLVIKVHLSVQEN